MVHRADVRQYRRRAVGCALCRVVLHAKAERAMSAKATKLHTASFRAPDRPEGMAYWASPPAPSLLLQPEARWTRRGSLCNHVGNRRVAKAAYSLSAQLATQ